jgi:hypothetical protein
MAANRSRRTVVCIDEAFHSLGDTMKQKYLATPAYLVALLLILFPLVDTTLGVWPLRFTNVGWRFGTIGMFSRAVMTPALGVLIIFTVALLFEHRRTLRTVSILNAVMLVLTLIALPLFMLDGLQNRATIRQDAKLAFDVAIVVAVCKMLIGALVTGLFAWYGWRASRKDPALVRADRSGGAGLVGR